MPPVYSAIPTVVRTAAVHRCHRFFLISSICDDAKPQSDCVYLFVLHIALPISSVTIIISSLIGGTPPEGL